jgi:hypothetical protein
MAKGRRKLLPKDFEALLDQGKLEALQALFDGCEWDARGGFSKQSALAFHACPNNLARWLVTQGADIEAADNQGQTPLLSRAGDWRADITVLLELGANVHARDARGNTALHHAARIGHLANARALLERGVDANARNANGQTPLVLALEHCSNATIARTAPIAELLLPLALPTAPARPSLLGRILGRQAANPSPVTPAMQDIVRRIGHDFEFHRAGFNPESLDATDAALSRLYLLFGVAPLPRRLMHDGKARILATAATWEARHQELWQLLVPSGGAAATVQGEAIRLSGRIADEIDGNGGINWDSDYAAMADALLAHLGSVQLSSCRSRLRTSPSMSASRVRSSSIRRTAWITVE